MMLGLPTRKRFTKPGRTVQAFLDCRDARVTGIMGPQGGGKTTGVIAKTLIKAAIQPPSKIDGIARYRLVVWMRTYRELWAKVIPDWLEWVPQQDKSLGITWNGGRDNPAEHAFTFDALVNGHKRRVQAEVWFRAIGDQTPQEAAKGLHMTDGWLPEATSATFEMFEAMFGRLGRYPSMDHCDNPYRELMCDWNAGDPYNWTTEFFVYGLPANARFFRQPGGRTPQAENVENLPPGYYDDQVEANAHNPDWIRRMIDNEVGFIRDGKPVYGEDFREAENVHYAGLQPWKNVPLVIAADAGLSPALVIGQRNSFGEWRILDEVVCEPGTGAKRCAEALNAVLGSDRYAHVPRPTVAFCDPTAANPTEASSESDTAALRTWMTLMSEHTGIQWRPSRCKNNLEIRQEGVRVALRRRVETRPAVQISGLHCPKLIMALARDYKFRRVQTATAAGVVYAEKPDKGPASHIGNAFEYLMANGGEQEAARGEQERRRREAARAAIARPSRHKAGPIDPLRRYRA